MAHLCSSKLSCLRAINEHQSTKVHTVRPVIHSSKSSLTSSYNKVPSVRPRKDPSKAVILNRWGPSISLISTWHSSGRLQKFPSKYTFILRFAWKISLAIPLISIAENQKPLRTENLQPMRQNSHPRLPRFTT